MDFISHSENDTNKFAKKIAKNVVAGDILALFGELGSGKTTFTKYLAKELGISENITSPTFVIEKRYVAKSKDTELIHIDCYRMDEKSVEQHYLNDLFADNNSIKVIEWSEKIEKYLPEGIKKIKFEYQGENERKIIY